MSRISRLDRSQVTPETAALYDKVFAQRGNVPNMFRVMAHRPEIFATMQAHFSAVLNTGTVSTKTEGTDHRPHEQLKRDALLPGQPHRPGQEAGAGPASRLPICRVVPARRLSAPLRKQLCGWQRPSPATRTR